MCHACNAELKNGKSDLGKHAATAKHKKNVTKIQGLQTVTTFFCQKYFPPPLETEDVLTHISLREIKARISQTKTKSVAGPDCIQKQHLNRWTVHEILHLLFNLLMYSTMQSTQWRMNRT
jgi:hypothetical protein